MALACWIFLTARAHNSTCMQPFCPTLIEKTTPVINRERRAHPPCITTFIWSCVCVESRVEPLTPKKGKQRRTYILNFTFLSINWFYFRVALKINTWLFQLGDKVWRKFPNHQLLGKNLILNSFAVSKQVQINKANSEVVRVLTLLLMYVFRSAHHAMGASRIGQLLIDLFSFVYSFRPAFREREWLQKARVTILYIKYSAVENKLYFLCAFDCAPEALSEWDIVWCVCVRAAAGK